MRAPVRRCLVNRRLQTIACRRQQASVVEAQCVRPYGGGTLCSQRPISPCWGAIKTRTVPFYLLILPGSLLSSHPHNPLNSHLPKGVESRSGFEPGAGKSVLLNCFAQLAVRSPGPTPPLVAMFCLALTGWDADRQQTQQTLIAALCAKSLLRLPGHRHPQKLSGGIWAAGRIPESALRHSG